MKHFVCLARERAHLRGYTVTEHWVHDREHGDVRDVPWNDEVGLVRQGWRLIADPKASLDEVLTDPGGFSRIEYLHLDMRGVWTLIRTWVHAGDTCVQTRRGDL